jgi:hypothetical protein
MTDLTRRQRRSSLAIDSVQVEAPNDGAESARA